MPKDSIIIAGAREHNLKNIHLSLPREKLIVVTGLSGSGKSSLAFDTIYAEGQRKYVESLSAYARQFLEQLQKPDVDYIEGLSPAIAIEQRFAGSNPRSTIATTTEIYEYLRPALRQHRQTALLPVRAPDHDADHQPDRRPDSWLGRRDATHVARPAGARSQGRIPRRVCPHQARGFRPCARRRRNSRRDRSRQARQAPQPQHRIGRGPAHRLRQNANASRRFRRDDAAMGIRFVDGALPDSDHAGHQSVDGAAFQQPKRVPRMRHQLRRVHAPPFLV